MKILHSEFFEQKTLKVARLLVGKYIVRRFGGKTIRFKITEVEAYIGAHDLASHSSKGRTARTEVMFGKPGTIYIYFVYGMHWMLNIVTEKENHPSAILIRGIEGVSGPGRVTKALSIDKKLNGLLANKKNGLWFEYGHNEERSEKSNKLKIKIVRTPRMGVDYAGPIWSLKPYRFVIDSD